MKVTAFSLILFFVCLNGALYIVNETQVLPYYAPAYENPNDITNRFLVSLGILGGGVLAAILSGNPWIGVGALAVFVGSVLFPFLDWALFGFINFLEQIAYTTGNPALVLVVVNVGKAIMTVIWFWFLLGMVSQRVVER